MKKLNLFFLIIISVSSFGQDKLAEKQINNKKYIEVIGDLSQSKDSIIPDNYAMYPNGMEGIIGDIIKNFKYPRKARKAKAQGQVIVQFYVGESGEIRDIEIVKEVSPELDAEAIRIIGKLQKWIPAVVNGKSCSVRYKIPIRFKI